MVEYSKVNVKLSDRQLKQLKTAVKDKAGITPRMSLKILKKMSLKTTPWIIIDNRTKKS